MGLKKERERERVRERGRERASPTQLMVNCIRRIKCKHCCFLMKISNLKIDLKSDFNQIKRQVLKLWINFV
jgi:hypothetical protein